MMKSSERHRFILEALQKNGSIEVSDLSRILKVSSVTIRKDLDILEEKKLLYRTHGGAILGDPYISTRHVQEKKNIHPEEKERIGKKAAELISPGDAIIIASGSTICSMAKSIPSNTKLTVITSAMNVAGELLDKPDVEIIQLGGTVRHTSASVVSEYAIRMLENFSCSKLFLGVDGIDMEHGLTTTNLMEACLNKAMIKASMKTIVLADSSKFGRRGFSKICDIDAVDHIITDSGLPEKIAEQIRESGIRLTIV